MGLGSSFFSHFKDQYLEQLVEECQASDLAIIHPVERLAPVLRGNKSLEESASIFDIVLASCKISKFNSAIRDDLVIVMGLIRLESVATDVMITLNLPNLSDTNAAQDWMLIMSTTLASFQVLNPSLFL
jgi:hypothetical protein